MGHASFIMPGAAAVPQGHGFSHSHGAHLQALTAFVLLQPPVMDNVPVMNAVIMSCFMG